MAGGKGGKKSKGKKTDPDAIGDRDVGKGMNWYSIEKEIAMGKQYANEIERQAKIIDDPTISEYVNRVGQNLVRNSDCKVPVTIKVIDTDEPNAMALPGGFFYVNTGLLTLADNESEVAGVMGHEIAHIAARHGTKQATRGQMVNLATIPLIFMGGWTGYGIRQAVSILVPIGFLQFSRAFESDGHDVIEALVYRTLVEGHGKQPPRPDVLRIPTAAVHSLNGGLMGLATKLNGLGLDMGQIQKLGHEVFGYAEGVIGKEKVQQIAASIPGLSQFL